MPLPQDMDLLADRAALHARTRFWHGISVVGRLPAAEPATEPGWNWENEKKIPQKNIDYFMTRVKNSMQDHRDMQFYGPYFFIVPTGRNIF